MNASLMQKIIQKDFKNDNNSEINKMLATVLMQTTNFKEKYKDDNKYYTIGGDSDFMNNTGHIASG